MNITLRKPLLDNDPFFGDMYFTSFPRLGFDLAVDIYEEKNAVIAKMNLPGMEAKDIDVVIEDGILTVSGTRTEETEKNEKEYHSKEIRAGAFSRSLRLPRTVDPIKTRAGYKDGVLIITAPIVEGKEAKEIKIEVKKVTT